jgi:flavodoxin
MKALVIYDTNFGNTKMIAEAIAKELGKSAKAISVSGFDLKELKGIDLLVAGSPIVGWKPSGKMEAFLAALGKDRLKGYKAATFDTRVKIFVHGDAAKKISQKLQTAGAEIIVEPQAFYVRGKEGPLFKGEKEKAMEWAGTLKTGCVIIQICCCMRFFNVHNMLILKGRFTEMLRIFPSQPFEVSRRMIFL